MKASKLIRKLALEIEMHGDMELSLEILDKDYNQMLVTEKDIEVIEHLRTIRLSVKPD